MPESEVAARRAPPRVPVLALGRAGHRRLPDRAARRDAPRGGGAGGRSSCRRPSTTRSPATTPASWSRSVPAGVVETWAWVAAPAAQAPPGHPVRLGADPPRRRHTACSTSSTPAVPTRLATGDRVTARFRPAGRAGRGHVRHRGFVPVGGAVMMADRRPPTPHRPGPGDHPGHPHPARLRLHARGGPVAVPPGPGAGHVHGPALSGVREGLRALPRVVPDRRGAHRRGRGAGQRRARSPPTAWSTCPSPASPSRSPTSAPRSSSTGPTSRSWASSKRSPPTRSAWACGSRRSGSSPTELTPSLASVKYFRPNGEPDADYETFKEYL